MEFKRINDTELVSVSEETNLLVEVNGEIKRVSSTDHISSAEYTNDKNETISRINNDVNALKSLAVTLGCAESVEVVTGETVTEVIQYMEQNTPFGNIQVEGELLPETEVELIEVEGADDYGYPSDFPFGITKDGTYTVIYDGVTYKCQPKKQEFPYGRFNVVEYTLGYTSDGDSDYPFQIITRIIIEINNISTWFSGKEGGTHTISIRGMVDAVKTLDSKFIPGGFMTVRLTESDEVGVYTADKTFTEIEAAIEAGYIVQAMSSLESGQALVLPLTQYYGENQSNPGIIFATITILDMGKTGYVVSGGYQILPDNSVNKISKYYTITANQSS